MNFLLDENFPKSARLILECAGHEVFDFRQLEVPGSALDRSAVILTIGRDFFHTLPGRYPDHHCIAEIALKQPTRQAIIGRLEWLLDRIAPADFAGHTFQLRDRTWMVYPALDPSPLCD